jgi:hypothetical protein
LNSRIKLIYAADSGLDEFRHDPVGAGAVRFNDIAAALRAFGYRGDTVLEILTDEPDRALASQCRAARDACVASTRRVVEEDRDMTRESNEEADAKAKLIVSRFTENAFCWEGAARTSNITSVATYPQYQKPGTHDDGRLDAQHCECASDSSHDGSAGSAHAGSPGWFG